MENNNDNMNNNKGSNSEGGGNYNGYNSSFNNGNGMSDNYENNNWWAILAYLIFLIPLLAGPKDPFVRYHTNQGTVLVIASVILAVATALISGILTTIISFLIPFSFLIKLAVASCLKLVCLAVIVIFIVIGIRNVLRREMKPLPFIGKFQIL